MLRTYTVNNREANRDNLEMSMKNVLLKSLIANRQSFKEDWLDSSGTNESQFQATENGFDL